MIVDFHCHVFNFKPTTVPTFAASISRIGRAHGVQRHPTEIAEHMASRIGEAAGEALIRDMDDAGIDVSVLFALDNPRIDDDAILKRNRDIADVAERYPGRIVPFAAVDPRRANAPDLLRRCIDDFGVRGLKLHPDHGYSPTGPECHKLIEVAHANRLVLITHTGPVPPPQHNRFAHPFLLDDIGCDFPGLKIIAAHSGGLWHQDWASIATFNDNMFGDLAEWQVRAAGHYERFCHDLRNLLDIAPDRMLMGSDWPAFESFASTKQLVQLLRQLPREAPSGLSFAGQEIAGILGENAQRLLNL